MTKSASDTLGRTFRRYAALAALMIAAAAGAQEYPNQPIRIVVPFPPGGLVDTVARLISSKLADALGQRGLPVVVDNRSGAGGSLGTEMVAKSAPDGYTLLMVVDTHAVNPHIYKTLRYNIFTDLAPISLVVKIPLVIVAHPSLPADSIKELVALAKSKPGALSYASAGAGTAGHLAAEQFKLLAGIDIVHVPYKGGAPAITDLLGGQAGGEDHPAYAACGLTLMIITPARTSPAPANWARVIGSSRKMRAKTNVEIGPMQPTSAA